jgi:hypothetical protein
MDRFIEAFAGSRGYTLSSIDMPSGSRRHRVVEQVVKMMGFGRAWHVYRTLYIIDKASQARLSQTK